MGDDFEIWQVPLRRDAFLAELGTTTPEAELDSAVRVAGEGISALLGKLADRMLGRPGPDDEGYLEHLQAKGEMTPAQLAEHQLEWHLLKMQLERRLGLDHTGNVINARRLGASWQTIGEACGISRQAAYDRWASLAAAINEPKREQASTPATPPRDWKFVRTRDLEHWQVGYDNPETHRWTAVSEHTSCEAARAELYARLLAQKPTRADREAWLQRFDLAHHELVDVAAALGHPDTAKLDRRQLTELILTAAATTTALA